MPGRLMGIPRGLPRVCMLAPLCLRCRQVVRTALGIEPQCDVTNVLALCDYHHKYANQKSTQKRTMARGVSYIGKRARPSYPQYHDAAGSRGVGVRKISAAGATTGQDQSELGYPGPRHRQSQPGPTDVPKFSSHMNGPGVSPVAKAHRAEFTTTLQVSAIRIVLRRS